MVRKSTISLNFCLIFKEKALNYNFKNSQTYYDTVKKQKDCKKEYPIPKEPCDFVCFDCCKNNCKLKIYSSPIENKFSIEVKKNH